MKADLLKSARTKGETMSIEVEGLTSDQAEELKRMLGWLTVLGGWGCSRQITLNWDGDGGARARFSVDGKELKPGKDEVEEAGDYNDLRFSFE